MFDDPNITVSNASPRLRRLLNIASVVCLVACVALIGMWVRSYRAADVVVGPFEDHAVIGTWSEIGRVGLGFIPLEAANGIIPWSINTLSAKYEDSKMRRDSSAHLGFAKDLSKSERHFVVPYWFLVLTSGTLAMAFQIRWPWRFNLRSMFVLTTFLAVVLGMIAWLDRAWIGK